MPSSYISQIKCLERLSLIAIQVSTTSVQNSKRTHVKNVDIVDIRAYFRILYLRAARHFNLLLREEIWGHESASDLFAATLSQNWFKFIN